MKAVVFLIVLSLTSGVAFGQQPVAPAVAAINDAPASLVVWNRTLALFRTALGGASPRERTSAAAARVEAALDRLTPADVRANTVQLGDDRLSMITAANEVLFAIHERDLPQDSSVTLDDAGALVADRLQRLLRDRTEQRRWPELFRSIGFSALATLAFIAAWILVARIRQRVAEATAALAARRIARDEIAGIDPKTVVSGVLTWLVGVASFLAVAAGAYLWLTYVLNRFAYSRPWGMRLGEILLETVSGLAAGFVHAIPGLIAIGVIFLVTRTISRAVRAWFHAVEHGRLSVSWLDPLSARAGRKLVVTGIWLFALTVAYPYVPGADTDAFKGVSVVVGLMVSLGSAGVVGQILSGFFILFNRSLRPGEFVQVGDVQGVVKDLGMTAIRVSTLGRKEVIIPNAVAVGTSITNLSRVEDTVVVNTTVTIGYGTPWRQVRAMLVMAASRTEGVLREPQPEVFETELSSFFIQYELVAYASPEVPRAVVKSRLHEQILDIFNEHDVQIMTPHFEGQPEQAIVVPRSRWFTGPAGTRGASRAGGDIDDGRGTAT
jgi:small-conductance mechanosensitive channel